MYIMRGMIHLARGAWDEAEHEAAWGMDAQPIMRCPALVVTGRARVRRGDGSGDDLLAQGFQIAVALNEAQRLGPAGSALVEAGWLRGEPAAAVATVAPWYDEVLRYGYPTVAAQLGFWLRQAGHHVDMPAVDHPYTLLAEGRWREAADAWLAAGCAYEQALALAASPDAADLLEALSIVDGLGAEPLARIVRTRLRDLGVARIPRGPTPSTRDNPAGLTDRQVEVVRLLADGLTNSEIAARLVLSVRTVDTHVAAILGKLDARTRREAVGRAEALGLVSRSRPVVPGTFRA
jgi:DNA-binding CsgD family transcriptional regulator